MSSRKKRKPPHSRGAAKMLRKCFNLESFDVAIVQHIASLAGVSESALIRAAIRDMAARQTEALALVHREQVEWAARPDLHGGVRNRAAPRELEEAPSPAEPPTTR